MILFAAYGVAWAILAPRILPHPGAVLAGQAAGLALAFYLGHTMFGEGSGRALGVLGGVYLLLAVPFLALAFQVPGLPEVLRDPELSRLAGFLGPLVEPCGAFEAARRALGD